MVQGLPERLQERKEMKALEETLSEFGVEDLTSYEADLIQAGRQDVYDDLDKAAKALLNALQYLGSAPRNLKAETAAVLEEIEETLLEIEG